MKIQEKQVADFPTVPEYRTELVSSHQGLGFLLNVLGKPREALQQYRKAVAVQEQLIADLPTGPDDQVTLGARYFDVGFLVQDGGQPGESLPWFDKAIRTLSAVHEKDRVLAKQDLCNSHLGRANAYDRLHQYAKAVQDWDKAIELSPKQRYPAIRAARATSRSQPGQVAEAVAEVAELTTTPNWDAGQWYDFACVYAVASGKSGKSGKSGEKKEYAMRAMKLLGKAVQAGYKDAGHMAKDTDLDFLRGRDDFKKLLAELGTKSLHKTEQGTPK